MSHTDFSQILKELQDNGFNDYKMSEITKIERSKLSRLRTGKIKQATYDDGVKIMKVFSKEMKKLSK